VHYDGRSDPLVKSNLIQLINSSRNADLVALEIENGPERDKESHKFI